jgi:hypothetical protein
MTGKRYFNILNKTDPEEIDAIIERLFLQDNKRVYFILYNYDK